MKNQLRQLKQNNLFNNNRCAVIFRNTTGILFFVLVLSGQKTWGQLSLTNAGNTATLDFSNSMPATVGSNPSTAFTGAGFSPDPTTAGRLNSNAWATTGWSDGSLAFGGTNITGDHARGAVSTAQTTGGFYSFTGSPQSAGNPCLMIQPGGSDWAPGTLTLRIKNDGTTNITQLAVSYNIYVRNDQLRSNSFNFSYSTDNVSYTPVGALDYTSTAASDLLGWVIVGSAPSRSTTITGLSLAPNSLIYIRWSGADVAGSNNRDEFGLDDISLNATFAATAGTFTPGTLSAFGNVCVNTIAGPNSFSLSGSSLDGSTVTVGPLAGFTFDNGGGYGATATITGYGTSFSTTINVKFNPTAPQAYGGTGVNGIPVSGGNGATVHVDASGTGIAIPSITAASASPNPSCSGDNVLLSSIPSTVFSSAAVGTSTGNSVAGNTPYRSAITTEARVQYIFTSAELSGIGMAANSSLTSLAFNVTTAGSGTMTNYTISIAATATTSFPSTSYLTGAFTTVYGPQSYTAVSGVNTHTFSTPFTWNGTSGIVINICYNSSGGTSTVVSVNTPGGSPTNSRSGSGSCGVTTGTLDAGRPVATFGYSTNPNPNIYDWSWSPGGATTNSTTVNPTSDQSYTVTATTPGSACTASSVVNVTVNQPSIAPTSAEANGLAAVSACNDGNQSITLTQVGGTLGTGASWKWYSDLNFTNLVGTGTGAAGTLTLTTGTPTTTTTYYVRAEDTAGPCAGTVGTNANNVTVSITIPPTISCIGNVTQGNDSPLCNAVVSYGAPTVGGTSPAVTYLFSGATSGSGSGHASGSTFNVGTTTVALTATNGCGSDNCSFDVEVTKISPTAPASITSDDPDDAICVGQSIAFTAGGSTSGSAGGVVFWYEGGCGSGAPLGTGLTLTLDGQGGNPPVPTAGTHTYYARVQDNCLENTACASISINVSAGPPATTITAVNTPVNACSGDQALVTATTSGGPGVTYSWVQGSGSNTVLFSETIGGPFTAGPIATTSPQIYVEFGTPCCGWSGYYICAQAVNGCGSTVNFCKWVRGIVNGPGAITPSTQVVACPNDVKTYSCGPSNGATVYTWTLNGLQAPISPNGGNNPSNVSVTFPSNFTSGQLCVTAALACMGSSTSPARCITISKNPSGPGTMTGLATVCPGATNVSYSIPTVPGASGYNWTVPANATISSGINTTAITVNFPTPYTGSASVCVSSTSLCGASSPKCKTVVSGIPNQPAGITGPLTNVCNSIVQYSVVNPAASSYTWTSPPGTTISLGQGNSTIQLSVSPTFVSGNLTVVANSALCPPATSPARLSSTFVGKPNTPGTITQSPPGAFCSGANLNFSVTDQTPGPVPSYTWTSSNGAITAGQGTNNIDVTWGTNAPGTITVKASNGCGISAGTRSQVFNTNNCREEEGTNTLSSSAFAVSVYPNPSPGKTTVSFYSETSFNYTLKVIDHHGRVVLSNELKAAAGDNTVEADMSKLAKGLYLIEVAGTDYSQRVKVVVQ